MGAAASWPARCKSAVRVLWYRPSVVRRLGFLPGFVLIAASTGCLLYTDPINVPPTVQIASVSDIARGAIAAFTATAQDDQGSLTFRWGVVSGPCPDANAIPAGASWGDSRSDTTYSTVLEASGDYCVYVEVTDQQGAKGYATRTVHVADRAPSASIGVMTSVSSTANLAASVPLYTQLHFVAQGADPDPGDLATLKYSWSLTPPCVPPPSQADCSCPGAPNDACVWLTSPGPASATLTVTDGEGLTGTQTLSFTVAPDAPPCIIDTDPPSSLQGKIQPPDQPLSLVVRQVADDGDPYPAPAGSTSKASFVWSSRVGTAPFARFVNVDLPQLDIPVVALPGIGQQLQVRVEVHDRVDRNTDFMACYAAQPQPLVCEMPAGSGCAGWVTWTVTIQ
jgi:hypothetical protein